AFIRADELAGTVKHTFTHFHLELQVMSGRYDEQTNALWSLPGDFGAYALPTVMKKVANLVEENAG
ncbi:MAG: NUDIX domain-containing protein, partial [Rhodospirillales bacterium]|nr:NUDIX domain-containing protein [Rhodospirillales bacterium]